MSNIKNRAGDFVQMFLMKHQFNIVQRDYERYCGQIDLISEKGGDLHFFEIQCVSQETLKDHFESGRVISPKRMSEIEKTAQLFMREIGTANYPWHIHLVFVVFLKNSNIPKLKITWDANL